MCHESMREKVYRYLTIQAFDAYDMPISAKKVDVDKLAYFLHTIQHMVCSFVILYGDQPISVQKALSGFFHAEKKFPSLRMDRFTRSEHYLYKPNFTHPIVGILPAKRNQDNDQAESAA